VLRAFAAAAFDLTLRGDHAVKAPAIEQEEDPPEADELGVKELDACVAVLDETSPQLCQVWRSLAFTEGGHPVHSQARTKGDQQFVRPDLLSS
jgi:hypothetical protein